MYKGQPYLPQYRTYSSKPLNPICILIFVLKQYHNHIHIFNFNMNPTLRLAICFGFLVLGTLSSEVEVTCQNYPSCQSGLAYIYKNSTDTEFECTDSCNRLNLTVDVFDCQIDYLEQKCSTGVCVSNQGEVHACFHADSQCPSLYFSIEANATCQRCQTNYCPFDLCIKTYGLQICYAYEECNFPWVLVTYSSCPNGKTLEGQSCKCCHRFQSDRPIGVCSNNVPYDSPKLQGMSSNGISEKNEEEKEEVDLFGDFFKQFIAAFYL